MLKYRGRWGEENGKVYLLKDTKEKDEKLRDLITEKIVGRYLKKDIDIKIESLDELKVKSCIGCYECWFREYGVCPIDDDFNEINKEIFQHEEVYLLIRITYGMQSHKMKNLMDRKISEVKPISNFRENKWERKSEKNYNNKFNIIGYTNNITKKEEEIFKKIISENLIKYKNAIGKVIIVNSESIIDEALEEII